MHVHEVLTVSNSPFVYVVVIDTNQFNNSANPSVMNDVIVSIQHERYVHAWVP